MNRLTVSAVFCSILSTLFVIGCQRANAPSPSTPAPVKESDSAPEAPECTDCITVTPENFARAESDLYFSNIAKRDGFAKFSHNRTPTPIDQQDIVGMNRDTLYSAAVFDLDAGPDFATFAIAAIRAAQSLLVMPRISAHPLSTANKIWRWRARMAGVLLLLGMPLVATSQEHILEGE